MARANFGGGAADFTFAVTAGNLLRLSPATLYVWETETGDDWITDLLLAGSPVTTIPVGSDGQIPTFAGPDGLTELWVSAGPNGTRVILATPGQQGPAGPEGPQGEPGPALPEEQMDALSATIATRLQSEASDSWTAASDGAPAATAESGQAWQFDKNSVAGAGFVVSSGKLTHTATTGAVASYATLLDLPAPVTRLGGTFTFTGGDDYGGSADLIVWQQRPGSSGEFPANVPDSPFHLEVHPDRWALSVFQSGSIAPLQTALFAVPLAKDGTTVHRVEAYIIGSTAHIFLPDGSYAKVTDARIAAEAGNFPCWEIYQSSATADTKPGWLTAWADTAVDYSSQVGTLVSAVANVRPVSASNTESVATAWARAGARNTATKAGSAAIHGEDNTAQHDYSSARGSQAKTPAYGASTHASGRFASQGDAQYSDLVLRGVTTNATPTNLGTNGTTGLSGSIPISAFTAHVCEALVVARRFDVAGESAAYKVMFAIERPSAAAVALLGTPTVTVVGEDVAGWDVGVNLDTTSNVLYLQVTGEASKTIHWVAALRMVTVI